MQIKIEKTQSRKQRMKYNVVHYNTQYELYVYKGLVLKIHNTILSRRFKYIVFKCYTMSSGQNSGGLMSSAGLVRYFEEDGKNAVTINPKTIVSVCAFIGLVIHIATAL